MLEVRLASVDDAETVSALNDEVHRIHAAALPHLFKPPSPESFPPSKVAEILSDPDNRIYLAHLDKEPVGYLFCQVRRRPKSSATYDRDQVYIHHVSVNRTHQKRGVGTVLFEAAIQLAEELGIRRLGLDVWSFNTEAITFFEKQGFGTDRFIMSKEL